jgi:hypothetical protein
MEPIEYDVYISYREPSGSDLAKTVSAGLARRGFHVFPGPGGATDESLRTIIEDTPDFVLLLTPHSLDRCADEGDRMRLEIAHAIRTERNLVPVSAPGFVRPQDEALPADIASFDRRGGVPYSVRASEESIARIAHRLSSDAAVDERHVMREAKWVGSFVGLVLLALVAIAVASVASKMFGPRIDVRPLPPLSLYWSAFGQRFDAGRWTECAVQDGSRLVSGDQVRVMFSASADGYAYVLSKDLRGEVKVLFPSAALAAASRVRLGQVYQAPADGSWLRLEDQAGLDTLYVVASYDPIENLEAIVEERDEEASATARPALLESTLAGLLDGRHGATSVRVRTRRGRPIAESNVEVAPRLLTATTTLASGVQVTHSLTAQPGLLSAMSEIRVRYERAGR